MRNRNPWNSESMNTSHDNRDAGFTLIETMVALLVLSVGMIGVAALYGQALSASSTAGYRSQAIVLASELADRIRGNRAARTAYEGTPTNHSCDLPTGAGGVDCSPAEMAEHDMWLWQDEVARVLPSGQGTVDVDASVNPVSYTVTVSWAEPTSDDPVTFAFEFDLPIY
jgi:type IV pilus assembly protein PilV